MFWLSHHGKDERNRTYRFGAVRVCARCLGTYPALLAALVLQFAMGVPNAWREDVPWALVLTLPALLDWAHGRFHPGGGSNGFRTATGILLGLALGRTLYLHFQRPFPLPLLLQGVLVTTVALPVIFFSRPRPEA